MHPKRAVYPAPAEAPLEQMDISAHVRAMADVCVKCGLCLQHCPTYRLSGLEGKSPRGRIALVQGLAEGALPASGRTAEHLESCTGCLTCETVCPAQVPYGRLIDTGRAILRRQGRTSAPAARWMSRLSRRPWMMRLLMTLLRFVRRSGLDRVATRSGLVQKAAPGRLMRRLPAPGAIRSDRKETARNKSGTPVMLFTGCVGESLDPKTIADAVSVLEAVGAAVTTPADQVCCGALDLHDGRPGIAARLAGVNCRVFGDKAAPILTLASGCAAVLGQYGQLSAAGGERLVPRLEDALGYVDDRWASFADRLGALNMRIAVFEPCSVRNGAPTHSRAKAVLERLPGVEIVELDPGYGCCGAAGHHFVTRPEQADGLLAPIISQVDAISPDVVAVANIGCALHIGGAFRARGSGPEVLHPVSLVARSLAGAG